MAKPESIRKFDLFYLGSIVVGLIGLALGWDSVAAEMNRQMAEDGIALDSGVSTTAIIGGVAFGTAISLALWFLISVLRIEFVKWILALFTAYSVLSILVGMTAGNFGTVQIAGIVSTIMAVVAIYMLFRPDAKAWFEEKRADKREKPDMDGGVDLK